jgi:NCS1 family nucleobase:cation symporter-1
LGVFPSLPGFLSNVNYSISVSIGWTRLYYISFLVGFSISAVVFIALHHFFPAHGVKEFVTGPETAAETMLDAQSRWDGESIAGESVLPKDIQDVETLPKDI